MCKAPKPPKPVEPEKPEFLRNKYLDAALGQSGIVNSLRKGRSTFRIPLSGPAPIGTQSLPPPAPPAVSNPVVNPVAPPLPGGPGLPSQITA